MSAGCVHKICLFTGHCVPYGRYVPSTSARTLQDLFVHVHVYKGVNLKVNY